MASCVLFYMKWFLLFLHLIFVNGEISDMRLCANPSCDEPVSHAKTLLRYAGSEKYILTFLPNVDVVIYSKSAGSVPNLWGGTIKGKRGYFPKDFVREYKVLTSHLPYTVPTEKGSISEKRLELNESNKLQAEGTNSLPSTDINKETLNVNDEKSGGQEHAQITKLQNENNVSDNEIAQELGNNVGAKSANLDSVPSKTISNEKSTIEHVKPTKSVSGAAISHSKPSSANGHALGNDPESRQISSSMEDYFSASRASLPLTNIVAHTKEAPVITDAGSLSTAVWFPESKGPLRSFFGHGVSADSSVDDKASDPNGKLSPDLESWAKLATSAGNGKYVMVEGTQILMHDDEEPDTTAIHSLASTPGPSASDTLVPTLNPHSSDGLAPSKTTAAPVESTLTEEASVQQSGYLPSDAHQTSEASAILEHTKVGDNSNLAETTEKGGQGNAPELPEKGKETEKGSGGERLETTENQKSNEKPEPGLFDALKSFVTFENEIEENIQLEDALNEAPEANKNSGEHVQESPAQNNAEKPDIPSENAEKQDFSIENTENQALSKETVEKQNLLKENEKMQDLSKDNEKMEDRLKENEKTQDLSKENEKAQDPSKENEKTQDPLKENTLPEDLEEDDDDDVDDSDDDPEAFDIDEGADEDEEPKDSDTTESGKKPDSFADELKEKSYHDRLVEQAATLGSLVGKPAIKTSDFSSSAKAYEAQAVIDQSAEKDKRDASGIENVKVVDHENEGSAEGIAGSSTNDTNSGNGATELSALTGDEENVPWNDKLATETADSGEKDVPEEANDRTEEGNSDIVAGKDGDVRENNDNVTGKDGTVIENNDNMTQKDALQPGIDVSATEKDLVVESTQAVFEAGYSSKYDENALWPDQSQFAKDVSSDPSLNVSKDHFNIRGEDVNQTLLESPKSQDNSALTEPVEPALSHSTNSLQDESAYVTTEPAVDIGESFNTPLPEDEVTTESADRNSGNLVFSRGFMSNRHVEDDVGTCEGPGIDGSCGLPDEVFVPEPESSEQQSFWEAISAHVSLLRSYMEAVIDLLPVSVKTALSDLEKSSVSPRVITFVIIVGFFLFLLEISFIGIKARFKEASLIGHISSLDQKLFTITKERDILKTSVDSYTDQNLEEEYQNAQETIQTLEARLKSSQNDSGKLQNAVIQLQEQLNGQQKQFGEMQLTIEATQLEKKKLDEELQHVITVRESIMMKCDELTQELDNMKLVKEDTERLIKIKEDEVNRLEESNNRLRKEAQVFDESVKVLQESAEASNNNIQHLQETLAFKNNELEALKDCLLTLKIAQGKADGDIVDDSEESPPTLKTDDILERLMEVSSIKAELKSVTDERDSVLAKLETQQNARIIAEGQVKKCLEEVEQIQAEYDKAHLEREAAQTKLNVLSNYFKEKEVQLQKELGVQEAQRQQSQESVVSVTQRIAMYEQETNLYKSQIISLKAEIDSQERSYKNQLTAHEKKAHENWLAARAAERKLEESKQEAATLRNKLTLLEQEKANQALNQTQTDAEKASSQGYPGNNGEVPSPPRIGPDDRSNSMDLPTSSRSSIFSREPLDILHGIPFMPTNYPLPPPLLHGLPPGGLLPPPPLMPPIDVDGRPLPPFDPRRGMFPMPPPPPPPGPMVGGMHPEHWMGLRRRESPPFSHSSQRDRPSPPLPVPRSPPPFDRRPPSNRNAVSPLELDSRDMGPPYDRDYRERTPPARFFDPPVRPGFGGHPPPPMRGPPNSRPPMRRDVYVPGRADGSIDPRTSSPMTPKQDGGGAVA